MQSNVTETQADRIHMKPTFFFQYNAFPLFNHDLFRLRIDFRTIDLLGIYKDFFDGWLTYSKTSFYTEQQKTENPKHVFTLPSGIQTSDPSVWTACDSDRDL